jgi:ankyrin repeat protein
MLIDRGAALNVTDSLGRTPLHTACRPECILGHEASPEIIRVLIFAGADTQVRDSLGRLAVELLKNDDDEDRRSRAIYEEAVEEMKYGDLKPVLK